MPQYDDLSRKVKEAFTEECDMVSFDGGEKWLNEAWNYFCDVKDDIPAITYERALVLEGVIGHVMEMPGRSNNRVIDVLMKRDIIYSKLAELCYNANYGTAFTLEEVNSTSINDAFIQLAIAVQLLTNRIGELAEGNILEKDTTKNGYIYKCHELDILKVLNEGKLDCYVSRGVVKKNKKELTYEFVISDGKPEIKYSISIPYEERDGGLQFKNIEFTEKFNSDLAKLNFLKKYGNILANNNEYIDKFNNDEKRYKWLAEEQIRFDAANSLRNDLKGESRSDAKIYNDLDLEEVYRRVCSLFYEIRLEFRKDIMALPLVKIMRNGVKILVEKQYDYSFDKIKVMYMLDYFSNKRKELYDGKLDYEMSSKKMSIMEKLLAEFECLCQWN